MVCITSVLCPEYNPLHACINGVNACIQTNGLKAYIPDKGFNLYIHMNGLGLNLYRNINEPHGGSASVSVCVYIYMRRRHTRWLPRVRRLVLQSGVLQVRGWPKHSAVLGTGSPQWRWSVRPHQVHLWLPSAPTGSWQPGHVTCPFSRVACCMDSRLAAFGRGA